MKEYVSPEMEVVEFENEDVIATSTCNYVCVPYCPENCSEWCGAGDCFEGG